jgi:hypothetical protein
MVEMKDEDRVQLRLDASQAEAVLVILAKRRDGRAVVESDWRQLFATEPYERLKRREAEMKVPFTDEAFRSFLLSDDLAESQAELENRLREWCSLDLQASARRILAYLPDEARVRAAVYPVIKPKPNSFVYDVTGNAAIFLRLDTEQSVAVFENTVAHESHHIGFAGVARRLEVIGADLPGSVSIAIQCMGAFGEGFAMLAAAGDTDTHPHAVSPAEERARWDRDMLDFNRHLRELEEFFLDVIDERLRTEEEINRHGMSFFGIQGPWYTVGYRMSVLVERRYGRSELIECMTDPRRLLARYNTAATELNRKGIEELGVWSPRLLRMIGEG